MTSTSSLILAGVAAALWPGMSLAQDTRNQGYLVDSNGNIVTSATTGICVRDSDWTPAREAGCNPEPVKKAETPAPRIPTVTPPSPRAAPTPAPAKTLPQKINFSADALFAFNSSVLKPAGRTMLDGLVRELNGARYDAILVTGHTDRFGKTKYNQKLSERRAHAVRDYLVSRGIPANRIRAAGKGKTQPVTKAGDCPGGRTAKVIACLQPDRRVDVEVTGTKGPEGENQGS
ncbi:MAG: OmpA family protein [Betaproteobacteria bacterium]|nr:OmpA family protein [Betaproteobacteria bacterium]